MTRYAKRTKVPALQSRGEIERVLERYGADQFGYATQPGMVKVGFRIHERMVRFAVAVPDPEKSPQPYRQRWRALLLAIKAKLESVESGIEQFDEAFMAQIVLPDGQTMAEYALPGIRDAYKTGKQPPMLRFDG